MTKQRPGAAAAARLAAGLGQRKRAELLGLIRPVFRRTEAWLHVGRHVGAVMSDLPRRNSWAIARQFAVEGLDEAARKSRRRRGLVVDALDETGQEKQGQATAGVKQQHLGCAGGVEDGINTVHLSYAREGTGHALVGARQWIPPEHVADPVTSLVMGLPPDLEFWTKGQLAMDIVADAIGDGVRLDFVCGDEVYGNCTGLREYLEEQGQGVRAAGAVQLPGRACPRRHADLRRGCPAAEGRLALGGRVGGEGDPMARGGTRGPRNAEAAAARSS